MYLVHQFRDGELRQSEALAELNVIIFLKRIPPWQNDAFASLKFLFFRKQKAKNKLSRSAIVNRPLTS